MSKSKAYAVDCGTMFFQVADQNEEDKFRVRSTRNAFVEIPESEDIEDTLKRNEWQYIKDSGHFYVLGEDSLRVANMFPGKVELRRPLQHGVLNKGEEKKMLVLTELIRNAIGNAPTSDSVVCTCISSEPADDSVDSSFHKARLMGMFKNLGWHCKVIEEGYGVILSENPKVEEPDGGESPFSGLGLSFGAGRCNCVLSYKGIQVVGMSASKSGDWVDSKVAEATGSPISQVTKAKETKLDFNNVDFDDDIVFALDAYYREMINYIFSKFASKFQEVQSQFEAPVEVVVAGGTSMPKGFCDKVQEVIGELELPFEIKGVRHASEPREAVAKGCLTQALVTQRKLREEKDQDLEDSLG